MGVPIVIEYYLIRNRTLPRHSCLYINKKIPVIAELTVTTGLFNLIGIAIDRQ